MYQRQKAQFIRFTHDVHRLYLNGSWNEIDPEKRNEIIKKLHRLWMKFKHYLTRKELRRIMASLAFLAGFGSLSQAQDFGSMATNPFGLSQAPLNTGSTIRLADLDGDGDFDIIGANFSYLTDSTTFFFRENTGTKENPQFAAPERNPFGLRTYISLLQLTAITDLDGDGDLDLIAANYGSPDPILYFKNVGTKTNPSFNFPVLDPFNFNSSNNFGLPAYAAGDLDDDGDQDIVFFDYYGARFFENNGSPTSPSFASPVDNAFNIGMPNSAVLGTEFTDLDKDGDLDLLLGDFESGGVIYYKNIGTWTNPDFTIPITDPFGLAALNSKYVFSVASADLDNDGDVDLLFTDFEYSYSSYSYTSNYYYFENIETTGYVNDQDAGEIQLYPQPCTDHLTLDLQDHDEDEIIVTISGINGQTSMSMTLKGRQSHTIPVRDLAPGVYVVAIRGSRYVSNRKIIKQ